MAGLETGDFTGWTVNANNTGVVNSGFNGYPSHSGTFFAALGNISCCGLMSQTLATNPGTTYTISLFLNSNGTTPNEFDVEWNGTTLFDQINVPNTGGYEQLTFTVVGQTSC